MTKIEEMLEQKAKLLDKAQNLLDENKIEDAKAVKDEINALIDKIELQKILDKESDTLIPHIAPTNDKVKDNASFIRAAIKKFTHKQLTEAENALLLPTTLSTSGENGEGYILPQDIQTAIHKKIREYRSMRDVCGYIKTTALKGSFPIENFESVSGLVDFTDGGSGTDVTDIRFANVSFSLSEKAAFIKLSNTLLALTDNDLVAYIVEVFAKKAVVTENEMAVATLKSNKTVKTIADWKALKSSTNKDLDPAALYGLVYVTNQDGFDVLDSALDTSGRPILTVDPTQPSRKLFMGAPVVVFSNAMLPSSKATKNADGYAPIFYGNIAEGVKFVDLGQTAFATSSEAGFMSNTTIARLIEFVTTVQCDSSDKCYVYGQLKVADKVTTS